MKFYDKTNCPGFLEADAAMVSIAAEGLTLDYGDVSAIPFIVADGKLYFGRIGEEHEDILSRYMLGGSKDFLDGRYWVNDDAMAFWDDNERRNDMATKASEYMQIIINSFARIGINLKNTRICMSFLTENGKFAVVTTPAELKDLKPTVPNNEFFNMFYQRDKKLEGVSDDKSSLPNGISMRDYLRQLGVYYYDYNMKNQPIAIEESVLRDMVGRMIKESVRRINEAQYVAQQQQNVVNGAYIRKLVKEGIRRVVKEVIEEQDQTWRGVPGTRFIWHGEWSDPEIEYKGQLINANEVEDALWNNYIQELKQANFGTEGYDEAFEDWLNRQGPITLTCALDDMLAAQ